MINLNLVYPEKSDIKYKISKFPDGQQNIVIEDKFPKSGDGTPLNYYPLTDIQIKSRLNSWLDLEIICCAVASLKELRMKKLHLYVPYFLGARSDRKFENGGNNYLKIICSVINSLGFESVEVLDPHSSVLEACLDNFKKVSNKELVFFALKDLYHPKGSLNDNGVLVSPDAGASHKIYKLAEQIGYKGDIITCSKERDSEGKLNKTNIPALWEMGKNHSDKDFIIIDDICDGGATFINIAKALQHAYPKNKVYLIVTHGVFSKGIFYNHEGNDMGLASYFNGIYCTNSYSNFNSVIVKDEGYNFKQLNIF